LRHFAPASVDDIYEALISLRFPQETINHYSEHPDVPSQQMSYLGLLQSSSLRRRSGAAIDIEV